MEMNKLLVNVQKFVEIKYIGKNGLSYNRPKQQCLEIFLMHNIYMGKIFKLFKALRKTRINGQIQYVDESHSHMLRERSQTPKSIYYVTTFIWSANRQN